MINGAHVLLYSNDADADRVFFKDVLDLKSVNAGHGWLIFALPPAECALHPTDSGDPKTQVENTMLGAHLYFMCDDLEATMKRLADRRVTCTPVARERWGMRTTIQLPSGGAIGLYQPSHPTALALARS